MSETNDIKDQKTTVLGITFNSEEERRTYFREELRKKLPELKKMEGFPIGEDEDILKLSDPPYYTACPNPWLNDFIEEWEEEKKELEKQGKREADFEITEPYAADISEGKRNPVYTAHTYHTKVPHPAIMRYILHYTQPGDVIFDGFAGTGMTGVAGQVCDYPSSKDKQLIEGEVSKDVVWGKRNVINGDLSPVASFIAANYNSKKSIDKFSNDAMKLLSEVEEKYSWMYETKHDDSSSGTIENVIWSDVFSCSNCGKDVVFYEVAVNEKDGKVQSDFKCSSCSAELTKRSLEKAWETVIDVKNKTSKKIQKKIPVRIKYSYKGISLLKKVGKFDLELIEKITNQFDGRFIPYERMPEGRESRRNDKAGITHVHDFFSIRTLFLLDKLFEKAKTKECKLLINSQILNLSLLNRHRPGVSFPYNPLSGTLYIGSQISEANIFTAYKNKLKNLLKAFSILRENQIVYTGSATNSGVKSSSIDYIFTDPPFGANISYSELNFIWESFLKVKTNYSVEAIENRGRNQSLLRYNNLMTESFKEFYRILKPGKWMTVEFSNTSASVWNSIQTSIQNTGFVISNVSSLDKQLGSFKAVSTITAVKQDLIISCYKPSSEFDKKFQQNSHSDVAIWDFVEEHLNHLPIHLVVDNSTTAIIERSPKILFDRLIAFYVQKGLPVPIDAGKFQKGLREDFIERDGMFFTNEQVQEYDKKKKENPEFIKLSLLVSSEQDGVMWLKNRLAEESFTYQDIQPLWMQALAGVRKGDNIPELSVILEENFLKNDLNEWYSPDPEKEADLEKLRTKRLLRIFDGYRAEAEKPKAKIKEVRVEALREGFKQCYQGKDFRTIVTIGDKIPNNLLMEDEVLLQFYDIASSKV